MKTNLLLLDSFKNMESLVAYAFSFSHRTNRQLKIIYVYDFDLMQHEHRVGSTAEADPILANIHEQAKKEFEDAEVRMSNVVSAYLKNHSVDVPVEIVASEEKRLAILDREVRNNHEVVLLISNIQHNAVATGGALGYSNLIDSLRCPVFVIPEKTKYAALQNITYATNFHPDDLSTINQVRELLHSNDMQVTLLHNGKIAGSEEDLKLKEFLDLVERQTWFHSVNSVLMNEEDLLEAILDYMKHP